jgi:hypothetical protein
MPKDGLEMMRRPMNMVPAQPSELPAPEPIQVSPPFRPASLPSPSRVEPLDEGPAIPGAPIGSNPLPREFTLPIQGGPGGR